MLIKLSIESINEVLLLNIFDLFALVNEIQLQSNIHIEKSAHGEHQSSEIPRQDSDSFFLDKEGQEKTLDDMIGSFSSIQINHCISIASVEQQFHYNDTLFNQSTISNIIPNTLCDNQDRAE